MTSKGSTGRVDSHALRRTLGIVSPHVRGHRGLMSGGVVALLFEVIFRVLEPWPVKFVVDAVSAQLGADLEQYVMPFYLVRLVLLEVCAELGGDRIDDELHRPGFQHAEDDFEEERDDTACHETAVPAHVRRHDAERAAQRVTVDAACRPAAGRLSSSCGVCRSGLGGRWELGVLSGVGGHTDTRVVSDGSRTPISTPSSTASTTRFQLWRSTASRRARRDMS